MLRRVEPLWDPAKPSILAHVRGHIPADSSPGLTPGGERLPDEDTDPNALRWAPGALDGVMTHHASPGEHDAHVEALTTALMAAASGRKATRARRDVYNVARATNVVSVLDPLFQRLEAIGATRSAVLDTARWLVTEGRHREPVKLGIALLSAGADSADRDNLRALARHDEFTVFAGVALANTSAQPERELYELAQVVDGWGRINLVERLQGTTDPEIREWIFRTGFRNSVMNEYLAYVAATTGDLVGHLEGDLDDEALDAACDIVTALLDEHSPAAGIDHYTDAPRAITLLLRHIEHRGTRLMHYLVADDVAAFLAEDDGYWDERAARGWTDDIRSEARRLADAVRAKPQWEALALAGLDTSDRTQFYEAERVARSLGHDTFPAHFRRVKADPIHGNWWGVMQHATEATIDEVIALAESSLPLGELATGPGMSLGFGEEWAPHRALETIVQDLARFPERGWRLLSAALRSPTIRSRNMAINALFAWDRAAWPPEAAPLIERALADEPDERVRERLARLARGEPDVRT